MRIALLLLMSLFVHADTLLQSKQLLVVTTKDWNANSGMLQRYQKDKSGWQKIGNSFKVQLGRNGLGWGIGLHKIPKDAKYIKKEGDGRSPAGIFELKQAFGYAPLKIAYPYRVYTKSNQCVDDVHSRYYNKIINSLKVTPDYKSFEHMKLTKNYYKYGIAVNHNHFDQAGAVRGRGSCIFIHIKTVPTAGCTALSNEQKILAILKWLDPVQKPLLVQAPASKIGKLLKSIGFYKQKVKRIFGE